MDPNASLDLDDQVVAMMTEDVNPEPSPEPTPAPTPPGSETLPAPAPEPTPAPAAEPTPSPEAGETPAATEPVPEPAPAPEATPSPAPEPDLSNLSTETTQAIIDKYIAAESNGVYKTAKELEEAKGFETLATVPSLTEQLQNLDENKVVLANPLMEGLNEYASKGGENIELYLQLQKLNVDEMDPSAVIKTKMEMGNMGLTSEEIDAHIIHKYHQYDEEHDSYDAIKATQGKIDMKIDAAERRVELKGMQMDIKTPDAEKERVLASERATLKAEQWEPIISSTVKEFSKIDISLGEKDAVFEYAIPEETKADMVSQLRESIEFSDATLDQEGKEVAEQIVRNRFIVDNFRDIAKAIAVHARSLTDEQWMKEVHNPSATQPEVPAPGPQEKDVVEEIMEIEGMNRPVNYDS